MSNRRDLSAAAAQDFHLGNVWQLKGKVEAAAAAYQRVLRVHPHFTPAHLKLGLLMLKTGRVEEARKCYRRAVDSDPENAEAVMHSAYLEHLIKSQAGLVRRAKPLWAVSELADAPEGKIRLYRQITFSHHRSGWADALRALLPLHNRRGVLFDGSIEANFAWKHWKTWVNPPAVLARMREEGTYDLLATSEEKGIVPYTEPWVGFVHNPPDMPQWVDYQASPRVIFAKDVWKRSMKSCIGLFTLSEHSAEWVHKATGKPVSALLHPTQVPALYFDTARFASNPRKRIVQVGLWLRRLTAIHELPLGRDNRMGYEKVRLLPFADVEPWYAPVLACERQRRGVEVDERYEANTTVTGPLSVGDYDRLLAENLVFLQLHDASANNAVIECIARGTPILVNPLPAVLEYLGEDYPMYYDSLEEAAAKALDLSLIAETHRYLMRCDTREKIRPEYFLSSFRDSQVYRSI